MEVLVGVAIMSIIVLVMGMTVTTIVTNSRGTTERSVVLREVQNAGYLISRDVQMADDITLDDGTSGFPLILDIPVDTDENNNYSVNYSLDGDQIIRQVYDPSDTLIGERAVAEYIDVGATTFTALSFDTYELTIKASNGEAAAERSYQIKRRIGSL